MISPAPRIHTGPAISTLRMRLHTQSFITLLTLTLALTGTLYAFKLISSDSMTHDDITTAAILNTTADVCRALAEQEGRDFVLPEGSLSVQSLSKACLFTDSVKAFQVAIGVISLRNAFVDLRHVLDEEYHFDDESFVRGRRLITRGLAAAKANVKQGSLRAAQQAIGEIMHTLQDFYSHSNWIELGNRAAFSTLIRADLAFDNIADSNTPTCRNCVGDNCDNNVLESIIAGQKLTSGYFSLTSFSKPQGKCSHGGSADLTSQTEPRGGINKDAVDSAHGSLHADAARVATAATSQLLQDIRGAVGDEDFLRLMGISRSPTSSSSLVLCFVVDTTASMASVVTELRSLAATVVSSQSNKPSVYVLVPFNGTSFGPMMRTGDSDVFLSQINTLSVSGAGNRSEPRQGLSALLQALAGVPDSSEIFVFTDGPPGDSHLESTVTALIENTKSVVNFLLTDLSSAEAGDLYRSLAQLSGGQAVGVTEQQLSQALSLVSDSLSPALATLIQVVRNPGASETFSFTVDSSVQTLLVYVTGDSPTFTITSASGATQRSQEASGRLGSIQNVGNLHTVRLTSPLQTGQWQISVVSSQPYTLKAIGESTIDFFFEFVEVIQDPQPGFTVLDSRPQAAGDASLSVSVTGGSAVKVTEVTATQVSGSGAVRGTLEQTATGDYLVTMRGLPAGRFFLQLRGLNSSASNEVFQRQSSTQLITSTVAVSAQDDGDWRPGTDFSVPFNVTVGNGAGGTVVVRHLNDRGFATSFPSNLTVGSGGIAEGSGTLSAPSDTASGTGVVLVIEADSPGSADFNYVLVRLTVTAEVTDITAPTCEMVSVNANCTGNCSLQMWEFTATVSDGPGGSGVERVSVREARGTLNTTTVLGGAGFNVTLVSFTTTCCFGEVVLVVADAVGNVGTCFISSDGGRTLSLSLLPLWVSMVSLTVATTLYS
ncbi:von Willebrand factor A domain-containing protein 7-like isoform X1 [Alosa alosa]|nr:von Willebrand factor A domain-containing protein 7-like isoform X1 [Alosa alosa]